MPQDSLRRISVLLWLIVIFNRIDGSRSALKLLNNDDVDVISSWNYRLLMQQGTTMDGSGVTRKNLFRYSICSKNMIM